MEGSVRYAGSRIRVTTQLVDSVTGSHLWSETYEREFDDVFAIESDIAMNVANALEAEFSAEEQQRIERVPAVSAQTYAAYLRVLPQMTGAGNQGPQMLALLDRLIAEDAEFAPLHGWKAWTHANLVINTVFGPARDPAGTEAAARASAARALALDPQQPEARSALAAVDLLRWRWPEARATFESFARETGRIGEYHPWLSSWSEREAEALEIARRRVDRDPLSSAARWYLGTVLTYAHDYDAAAAAFERAIELAPSVALFHSWLAFAEIGRGNHEAAADSLVRAEAVLGDNRAILYLVDILYCYGRIGRSADALRIFSEIQAIAANQEIGAGGWAMAYLGIGDQDRALEQLRIGAERARGKVLDQGFFSLMNIRMNVTSDPVLARPEFAAARAELTGD
jgi:serine/threonine-protein kinase